MPTRSDRELGMHRRISRRDFIGGMAVPVGASLLTPGTARAAWQPGSGNDDTYPPARTGMRGSHDGSWEVGHQMRDRRGWDLSGAIDTGEEYDLVVVGGGISGLAAAHFFLEQVGRDARVLVLDNHDDFGGHAKRNEFRYNGRLLALNGGTLNIESPERYNAPSRRLLDAIGIDLDRFNDDNASRRGLYRRLGLGSSYFFDAETWGSDRLVKRDGFGSFSDEFLAQTPLSARARADLKRLGGSLPDYFPGLSSADKKVRLAKMSYTRFMLDLVGVDPEVMWFYQNSGHGSFSVGADALPALFAWEMGLPGFSGLALEPTPDGLLADLPGGQHGRQRPGGRAIHFPDGNATITRLLVRWLIPDAVPGSTQEDVGAATVDYTKLDRANQAARIRLLSTVVNVRHTGEGSARAVEAHYVRDGQTHSVRGRACVMACWNTVIPYLVPELPDHQKEALGFGVKAPLVYTSVAIRNWTSFERLGISRVSSPTMYHTRVALDEAVSLGELRHAESPDEPIVLSLSRYPSAPGLPRKEQHRLGRQDLLRTSFATFERNIRDQLGRILGDGGFDPGRDIVAITVNRWPHGYSYTYNSLYDPLEWVFTATNERPCVVGRQPFGQITIANADAAASPHTDASILEAHRAIQEVLQRRAMPALGASG